MHVKIIGCKHEFVGLALVLQSTSCTSALKDLVCVEHNGDNCCGMN